jgi:hypothetical protein
MKKILSLVATSVILMSLFTGCGSQSKSTSTQTSSTTESSTTANNQNKKMADLSGEVSAISDNQVTLKLIEMPTMPADKNGKQKDGQGTTASTNSSANQGTSQDGQKTNGTQPADQAGQKPKMEVKYTGETKTITISDGISITTLSKGEKDATEKTIAVKDIKVGDRLDISYSDSNKTTISKINVRGSNQTQTQTQN